MKLSKLPQLNTKKFYFSTVKNYLTKIPTFSLNDLESCNALKKAFSTFYKEFHFDIPETQVEVSRMGDWVKVTYYNPNGAAWSDWIDVWFLEYHTNTWTLKG